MYKGTSSQFMDKNSKYGSYTCEKVSNLFLREAEIETYYTNPPSKEQSGTADNFDKGSGEQEGSHAVVTVLLV